MARSSIRPHQFAARVLEASTPAELAREIQRTVSEPEGVGIMTRKGRIYPVWLRGVSLKAAPLLKQELLSLGGDSAHARGIADHSVSSSGVVLLATLGQYRRLIPKLRRQPFQLAAIADEVERALTAFARAAPFHVRAAHRTIQLGPETRLMGVLNLTPDSFSDGGRFDSPEDAVAAARLMVAEGADFIDVGGESTRPGAEPVDPSLEWERVEPVLRTLGSSLSVPISIDTRHPTVAEKALTLGVDIVNDVEGLRSPAMRAVVRSTGAAAIALHMRGEPKSMQKDLEYANLRDEVYSDLAEATDVALAEGIGSDQLLIDPGLGFGKSPEQNFELLNHLGEFRSLGFPVVVGASRKSFLGIALEGAPVSERLEAGIAAAVVASLRGARIVRTHDVAPTRKALKFVEALRRSEARESGAEVSETDPD